MTQISEAPTAIDREHEVFISYSRADGGFVRELQDGLAVRGRRAWVDWQDIPPTSEWMAEIEGAIEESDAVIYVLSPDSIASRTCSAEIEHALTLNKRIVPVLCRAVEAAQAPDAISRLNWVVATDGDLSAAVDRLIEALDTDLDRVRAHTRLLARTREWDASGGAKTLLLRGSQLGDAEALIGTVADPSPTPEQTRFVTASRHAATSRQRGLISIATAVAVLAAALGVFAWTQRSAAVSQKNIAEQQRSIAQRQTQVARSQALASLSTSTLGTNLDVGALLSLEALRLAPTARADQAVHVAIDRSIWIDRSLRGPRIRTRHLAFSPDGKLLVTLSQDGTLMRWDTATLEPAGPPLKDPEQAQHDVWCLAFSPDGSFLATGGSKGAVVLWDVATWQPVRRWSLQGQRAIRGIAFSPSGRTIATGSASGADLWDAATGAHKAILATPADLTNPDEVAFSPDGGTVAIGGWNPATPAGGKVEFWDRARHRIVGPPILDTNGWVYSISYSPDGTRLAVGTTQGTNSGTTTMWDTATHLLIGNKLVGQKQTVRSVAFSPDGQVLASASEDGTVFLWNTATGDRIGEPLIGHDSEVRDVAFSPDGSMLASVGYDGTVISWDLHGLVPIDHPATNFALSLDGRLMASVKGDRIALDDPTTGRGISPPTSITGPQDQKLHLLGVAVSPDDKIVAVGAHQNVVAIWDVASRSVVRYLRAPGTTWGLSFSADGRFLAAASQDSTINGPVTTWDTASWKRVGPQVHPQHGSTVFLTFSPVGDTFATPGAGITLWDASTQRRIGQLKSAAYLEPLAFSPDGSVIAGGGLDDKVRLWDTATLDPIGGPLVTSSPISSVAFSADGRTLAAIGSDDTITLWDVKTQEMIGEPVTVSGKWGTVGFTPDGRGLLLAPPAGPVKRWSASVWSDDPLVLRDRICSAVGRNLTHDEWRRFIPYAPYHRTCPDLPAA